MKFSLSPPNPYYDEHGCYQRISSENERWQIMLNPVMFGVRCNVGVNNSPFYSIDLCLGDDPIMIMVGYSVVKKWMEQFPEEVKEKEINKMFPHFEIKPVWKNPEWHDFVEKVANAIAC